MKFDPSGDVTWQLSQILNGGIEFGDHVRGGWVEVTIEAEEQEVFHNLGYTPVGFIVVYKDKAGDVWGTQLENWNNQSLWLASNVQNLTVRLFVM